MEYMKKIPLSKGKFSIVDDEDFEYLKQWKWYYIGSGYAARDEGKRTIYMHRDINQTPQWLRTDHINRKKLDNRRANLRDVTGSQNGINRGRNKNNTSGCRGVVWHKDSKTWGARIKIQYKTIYLGRFQEFKHAVLKRKKAEALYHSF